MMRGRLDAARALAVLLFALCLARAAHAAPPAGQLVVSADGLSVRDTRTGLVWQRYVDGGQSYTQAGAAAYCATLELGALTGFRLPTIAELLTIVDERRASPALDPVAFPSTFGLTVWSATPDATNAANAWTFGFGTTGFSSRTAVTSPYSVRCVR
jgi:hypothetical protein